jgi:RNA polymerase sigma-70 factor (sigma-E family)
MLVVCSNRSSKPHRDGRPVKRRGGSLEELYDSHIDKAVRLGYLLTGDEELAQDMAHDAFVRLFVRFHDIRSKDAFDAYLRRTIVNLASDRYRRRLLQRKYERAHHPVEAERDQPDIELRDELWRAMQELPPRQRAVVVIRYYEDLSEAQVGEALDCSPAAAKSLIARGIRRLRDVVGEMELN